MAHNPLWFRQGHKSCIVCFFFSFLHSKEAGAGKEQGAKGSGQLPPQWGKWACSAYNTNNKTIKMLGSRAPQPWFSCSNWDRVCVIKGPVWMCVTDFDWAPLFSASILILSSVWGPNLFASVNQKFEGQCLSQIDKITPLCYTVSVMSVFICIVVAVMASQHSS